ncbi:MAG: methyltransferase domain-containing protein [Methanobacterium sp.]|uniref:class I SAM-dependent methyltransferase n=1 Tax=Methanobacterium sp. TaxID=2164 RepID=UPI003C722B2C
MDKVKEHFEEEAKEFDSTILKLIPRYDDMINCMVSVIPFDNSEDFKLLDLGSGTGNITKAVKERYSHSKISCIDIAENMIQMAKIKLQNYTDIEYYIGDFSEFDFDDKYDVIVSSLALHHIKTNEDKKKFYSKIYSALKKGGIFLNSDVVLGSNEKLSQIYREKWIDFMLQNLPEKEVKEKWLPKQIEEDFPAPLNNHLKWLDEKGFKSIDVIWKYYGLVVYCGTRP